MNSHKNIRFYNDDDKEKYDNFLMERSDAYVFHTVEWKNVIEKTFKYKPLYIIAIDDDNNICAILPLFFINNFFKKKLVSVPFFSFGGFLGDKKYIPALIKKVFELKDKLHCKSITIKQSPNSNIYQTSLENAGMFRIEIRLNHYIELKDKNIDEIWMNISDKNRGTIRKAKKKDVIIERLTREEDLEDLHLLEIITRKKIGLLSPSINYYKNMWRELNPKNYLYILIAKHYGKIIAFAIFFVFNNRVVHVHVGSNNKGRKLGANNLILWSAIEYCCEKGYEIFDLGASVLDGKGNITENFKGIYFYKNSFNTINVPYSWYYYPKNMINIDLVSKQNFLIITGKKILRRFPLTLYSKTGTFLIKKLL